VTTPNRVPPSVHAPARAVPAPVDPSAPETELAPVLDPPELAVIDGGDPTARREESTASGGPSPTLMALSLVAMIGVIAYATFLLRPVNRGDILPYVLVLSAEAVVIGNALLSMWTILNSGGDPHDTGFHQAAARLFDPAENARRGVRERPDQWRMHLDGVPLTVEVFITAYGEPLEVIRRTAAAAAAMTGWHRVWILDDGRSDDVRRLADELGVRYVRRPTANGAKAGNINYALTLAKGPLFAILDADFVPRPDLLTQMVPFFHDPTVAFVQGPQVYGNMHNVVSRGAGYMQTVFYRFIQTGRNRFNAAFCVGTNVIFRRSAVQEIGGMYTGSKSEDVWTSILLHERGWRSIYVSRTVAVGDTPDTVRGFLAQQQRWATGGFEILFTHFPFSRRWNLTMDQRIQYWVTATFYATGIVPLVLLMVPPMQIYFDLAPISSATSVAGWLLFYAGFYGTQVLIALWSMGSFRWEVMLLSIVTFPAYLAALWNALMARDQAWQATGAATSAPRGRRRPSAVASVIPQLITAVFLALTSAVGVWKLTFTTDGALALVWNGLNTVIFGGFVLHVIVDDLVGRRRRRDSRRGVTGGGAPALPAPEPVGAPAAGPVAARIPQGGDRS